MSGSAFRREIRTFLTSGWRRSRRSRKSAQSMLADVMVLEVRELLSSTTGQPQVLQVATSPYLASASSSAQSILENGSSGASASSSGTVSPAFPLNQTFFLHSNPGANYTIYLDFDGETTTGTQWNTSYNGGNAIVSPAYDPAGDGAAFSNSELLQIQRIWQSVAEDYIPFDVDVTTELPATADLMNTGGGDTKWGVRAIVTADQSWLQDDVGFAVGGIAYLGSFQWNTDTPCWIFNTSEIGAREAISHEVGHTLGLSHDGPGSGGYYTGHGSGPTSWAPIMGAGYYVNVVQFSKGEYSGATNTEDDLAIITNPALNGAGFGYSGLSYRTDDYGSSTAAASNLQVDVSGVVNMSGIIERNTDVDVFTFTTSGGSISLNFDPYEIAPNLDIKAELLDSTGQVLLTSNPAGDLHASLAANLPAGTYYITVDGVGDGTVDTGYSDYGSLGQYTITGTISNVAVQIWTPLTNVAPGGSTSTMLMLNNGQVLVRQDSASPNFFLLTPDVNGNYVDGTWTTVSTPPVTPFFPGSVLLPDGRVFFTSALGSGGLTGEIYDPVTDTWSLTSTFPDSAGGHSPAILLPSGQILVGNFAGPETYLYDPATDTWTQTGTRQQNELTDRGSNVWTLLSDGSVLSYDAFASATNGVGSAQRYFPSTGTWVPTGALPVVLTDITLQNWIGPTTLLPDGRVFVVGGNNLTVIYNPTTNTWTQGPSLPSGMTAASAPGVMMPNGHFLFAADNNTLPATSLYDYNPQANTITDVTPTGAVGAALATVAARELHFLIAPNGHVLLNAGFNQLYDYTPIGSPDSAWTPTITGLSKVTGSTYTITGTLLNGPWAGASYGGNDGAASNYPLVRVTDSNGVVYYVNSVNWTPGVATGTAVTTTQFTLPSNLTNGVYQVAVIASGIASSNRTLVVTNDPGEPNDAISEATESGLSGVGTVSISGLVGDGPYAALSGDFDFYHFYSNSGEQVTVDIDAQVLGSTLDASIGIYNAQGTLLYKNDDYLGSKDSYLGFVTPAAGDYYVVVRGFGSGFPTDPLVPNTGHGPGSTGPYTLKITIATTTEPNDATVQATELGIISDGSSTVSGTIGDGNYGQTTGDYDFYHFTAQAGFTVTVDVNAVSIGSPLNSYVGVFTQAGTLLYSNDNFGGSNDSYLTFTAPYSGNYYVAVWGTGSGFPTDATVPGTGNGVGSIGKYDLVVTVTDSTEPNDSMSQAINVGISGGGVKTVGGYIGNGAYGNTTGDFDFFKFTSAAGLNVVLDLDAQTLSPTSLLDSVLFVFDSAGTLLFQNDNQNGGTVDSFLSFTTPAAGTYYVAVGGKGSGTPNPQVAGSGSGVGSKGLYNLTISINDGYEPNDSIGTAKPTNPPASGTATYQGFIGDGAYGQTTGDFDFFKFHAVANEVVTLDVNAYTISSSLDSILGVYNGAGTLLSFNDDDGKSFDSFIAFKAPATGYFYVAVGGYGHGLPTNALVPGTGTKAGKTGAYELVITHNPPPALTNVGASVNYIAFGPPVLVAPTAGVTDGGNGFANAVLTLQLTNGGTFDQLTVIPGNGITLAGSTVKLNGNAIGTVAGGTSTTPLSVTFNASATTVQVQTLLRQIAFGNSSANPGKYVRNLTITLTGANGLGQTTANKSVQFTVINNPPVIGGFSNPVNYTEGDPPVILAGSATVTDPDSANFDQGVLLADIITNREGTDRLAIRNQGTAAGQIGLQGNQITYGGTVIGTLGASAFKVVFNANATPQAVRALVRNITYQSLSKNPTALPRTVQVKITDGDGPGVAVASLTVNVTPVNDPPLIGGFTGTVDYKPGSPAVLVASNATVTDPDSPDFDQGVLLAEITVNREGTDRLAIRNQGNGAGQIGVFGQQISYGGTVIGTLAASAFKVTFNANATPLAVQALLRNITFQSLSAAPSVLPRTVQIKLTDGDGPGLGLASKTVNLAPANQPPVIDNFGGTVAYVPGNPPIIIGAGATVTDVDSANFNGGVLLVDITVNRDANDRLSIRNQGTGAGQIGLLGSQITYGGKVIGTLGASAFKVTFNTNATPQAVQALLRNITFQSLSATPPTASRTIVVKLTDGESAGLGQATKTIKLS